MVTYNSNRAHRLLTEFSRSRRSTFHSPDVPRKQTPQSSKHEKRETSLLGKVDIDTTALEKSPVPGISVETVPITEISSIKLSSTFSIETQVSSRQMIDLPVASTPDQIMIRSSEEPRDKHEELNFSITDITD